MNPARASKNLTTILQSLAEVGQHNVASALNVDESTITRLKEKIDQLSKMLAVLKLKVVPEHLKCYRQDYIDSLEAIAREHLNQQSKPPLEWD